MSVLEADERINAVTRVEKFVNKWRAQDVKYIRRAVITCPVCEFRLMLSQGVDGRVSVRCTTEECLEWTTG